MHLMGGVSTPVLLGAFAVGAGLLALWVDVRFPNLTPGFRAAIVHVGIAIVIGQLVVPAVGGVTTSAGKAGVVFLLFMVALPALVYCFLTSVWVIKNVQGAMRRYR
jgi:hypothetical protein